VKKQDLPLTPPAHTSHAPYVRHIESQTGKLVHTYSKGISHVESTRHYVNVVVILADGNTLKLKEIRSVPHASVGRGFDDGNIGSRIWGMIFQYGINGERCFSECR
jgi:hypothetical protein